jgi:hypothetical protein
MICLNCGINIHARKDKLCEENNTSVILFYHCKCCGKEWSLEFEEDEKDYEQE